MPDRSPPRSEPRSSGVDVERRWLRTDNILLVTVLGIFVWYTGNVLLLVFAGLLLGVGLDGLASAVEERTPLSHGWALLVVTVLATALIVAIGKTVVPQFLGELDELWERLGSFFQQVEDTLSRYSWADRLMRDGGGVGPAADAASAIARQAASAMLALIGILGSLIVLLAIAIFAAADPALYRRGLLMLLPVGRRRRVDETLSDLGHALRWWFLAQVISMLVIGVTTAVGLKIIGVDLWLSLGVLAGLFTFIPFLGPLIAGIPILIVAFAQGVETGLMVLVFFFIVENIEGNFLSPLIQQRIVDIAPVVLISMQVLMSALFGAMGLVLAAPVTLVAMIAIKKLYVEDVLGEPPSPR